MLAANNENCHHSHCNAPNLAFGRQEQASNFLNIAGLLQRAENIWPCSDTIPAVASVSRTRAPDHAQTT